MNEKGQAAIMGIILSAFIGLILIVAFVDPINTLVGSANNSLTSASNLSYTSIGTTLLSMIFFIIIAAYIISVFSGMGRQQQPPPYYPPT